MSTLLTKGNRKLGPDVWHFNLPAGPTGSCPGASDFCASACYAQAGMFRFQQQRYAEQLELVNSHPLEFIGRMTRELDQLPDGATVRIHTSGDFHTVDYVDAWRSIALGMPWLNFYAYTRSWRVPTLKLALEAFGQLPNVTLWASTDPTTGPAPAGWREATIVQTFADAPGMAHCPEQTGRRRSCSDCGLCWRAKPAAKLAFHLH